MRIFKTAAILLLLFLVAPADVGATESECAVTQSTTTFQWSNTKTVLSTGAIGQSFQACTTGSLLSIQVEVLSLQFSGATLGIQDGDGSVVDPSYTLSVSLTPGLNTLDVVDGYSVNDSEVYTFWILPGFGNLTLGASITDAYSGGGFWWDNDGVGEVVGMRDLRFEVLTGGAVPTDDASWGAVKALYDR